MKQNLVFVSLFLVLTCTVKEQIFGQSEVYYSQDQIEQDVKYLYKTLIESHFNLFVNTPEEEYIEALDNTIISIPDSLTLLEVYRLVQPFVALSELGHCALDYPFNRLYGKYKQYGGLLFPLNINIDKQRAFIVGNYSQDTSISRGSELLSINGLPLKDVTKSIHNYLSGESSYLKNTILDMVTFPRMMWILEETQKIYHVEIKDDNGAISKHTLMSIKASEFEAAFGKEKQLFQSERIYRTIDGIAYIKPGLFMNMNSNKNTSETNTFENNEFMQFIDSAFYDINNNKLSDLIIDIRNNSGGSNSFSDELLAYIADKPFKFCSKIEVKTSQITRDFWEQVSDTSLTEIKNQILSHENGEVFMVEIPIHPPKADSLKFQGNVYALINRYSYSQATLTAAMIQDYGFGTLIGETTADVPTNYGSIHQFDLPNTKIAVSYPKARVVRPNGDMEFKGTEPDILVERNVFSDTDEILDFTIDLIKNTIK